jgi:hypothetical protein
MIRKCPPSGAGATAYGGGRLGMGMMQRLMNILGGGVRHRLTARAHDASSLAQKFLSGGSAGGICHHHDAQRRKVPISLRLSLGKRTPPSRRMFQKGKGHHRVA